MSHDALKAALEQLPDPTHIEGTLKLSERFAIALPDGDVGALDDKQFVDWLIEHSEDAPFGHGGETKRDPKVRNAKRLVARGKASVVGFDVAAILPDIEAALSPRTHLDATLTDVITYEKSGKFAKHKDTPRTPKLVGTLVVGLPVTHTGGQFELHNAEDPEDPFVIDWSGKPDKSAVKWVALFSDVDHEVKPVTSGARVTLVYALSQSDRPRVDAGRDKRLAKLRSAVAATTLDAKTPLMITCTRLVITDGTQPQSIESLRGTDREIADTFVEAGFDVGVRACLVGSETQLPFTADAMPWSLTRLAKPIPDEVIAKMEDESIVSFTDSVAADEDFDIEATTLGDYVKDFVWNQSTVIRTRTAGTEVYNGMYSESGYFGNEASDGLLYTLAAIEVTKKKKKSAAKKATPKPKPKAKQAKAKKR